ncbi:MAG: hypothetical protein AAF266_01725 [Planctomycetota bacterium]
MTRTTFALLALLAFATTGHAAFVIEIDADGLDDGAFTPDDNFAFGGDTTTASTSVASPAFGLAGGDSLFGGDGVLEPDTYLYDYTPSTDGDNLVAPAGTALNATGDVATGLPAGGAGFYAIYAAWPATTGVSGGLVTFTLTDTAANVLATTAVEQNGGDGTWVKLFDAPLADAADTYTLTQTAGQNTFVSMRGDGVLFDYLRPIPEPTSVALALGMALCLPRSRRRRED